MISLDLIHCLFSVRLMQLALALDSGSACGVFPGQGEVGHAVPSVSAYNFTVCDDKAQLHRDKQADFCVALIYVANSTHSPHPGLCRYTTYSKPQRWRYIYTFSCRLIPAFQVNNVSQFSESFQIKLQELHFIEG